MLKVWGYTGSSNVQKVLWACTELGVAYERVDVGGSHGKLNEEPYQSMNPNLLVPTIEDGKFILWESNSCVRYLADKYGNGKLLPKTAEGRGDASRWMDWQLTTVGPAIRPVFLNLHRTPAEKRDVAAVAAGVKQSNAVFAILERYLAGRKFVAGDELSVGDIPLGPFVYRYLTMKIDRPDLPNVKAWYDRLCQREGYRKFVTVPL